MYPEADQDLIAIKQNSGSMTPMKFDDHEQAVIKQNHLHHQASFLSDDANFEEVFGTKPNKSFQ